MLVILMAMPSGAVMGASKLNVVATTPDLGAIASAVGGERVSVSTLAKASEDPHFVDAKPSFIVKLSRADALVEGGADLEVGWLPALLDQARNPRLSVGAPGRIACNNGIQLLEIPDTLDRSKGDVHAAGNPHYLTDPANAAVVAETIAARFAQLDGSSAETYRANAKRFTAQLNGKLNQWKELLAPCRGQRVAAYHDSWPYFAMRFGLKIDLFLEPKPGIPPTPVHLAKVIMQMRKEQVRAVLVEPYQGRKTADTVAAETGASIVEVAQYPGGLKGTESGYVELMNQNVLELAKALRQPHPPAPATSAVPAKQ